MLKKIVIVCIALITFGGLINTEAAQNEIKWYSYDDGLALSNKSGKKIFLHFYADWCHFCKEMKKRTFVDKKVIDYLNENFVSILIDADKDRKVTSNYFVRGLPATFFLTPDGMKIQLPIEENRTMSNIPGYLSEEMFLNLIRFVHTESYNSMSFKAYSEKNEMPDNPPKGN